MDTINLIISEPLGWILKQSGQLVPFGLAPIESESLVIGEPKEWKEVKVIPTISILTSCESELRCPADFCGQKLTKHHHSFDAHVREHVGLKKSEALNTNRTSDNNIVPLNYYCNHKGCIYSLCDGERFFTKLKYLKQHYLKVHAPKTFVCQQCQKSFGTAVFLEIHSRMCGQHFICSCSASYGTLEALQTHARRKCHNYDHAGYRNILKSVKQANLATKSEEEKTIDVHCKKTKKQQPYVLLPRPNGIVGNLVTSPWVFDECSFPLKVDFGTQTIPMNSSHHNGKATSHDTLKMMKRKKSAETQTSQVRVRISTETQTANVIKRRRSNRKKQLVEAETQCHSDEPETAFISSDFKQETVEYKPKPDSLLDPFLLYPMSTAKETNNRTTTTGNLLDEMTGYDVNIERSASSETTIENFLRDLEVHSQTQTDPHLFSGVEESNIFDDFDVNLNVGDTDVSEFLNFVTTETQTLPGIVISPSVMNVNANSSPTDTANTQTIDNIGFLSDSYGNCSMDMHQMLDDIFPCQKLQAADNLSANVSYLETMDNETQTQRYDFSSMINKMFGPD